MLDISHFTVMPKVMLVVVFNEAVVIPVLRVSVIGTFAPGAA